MFQKVFISRKLLDLKLINSVMCKDLHDYGLLPGLVKVDLESKATANYAEKVIFCTNKK